MSRPCPAPRRRSIRLAAPLCALLLAGCSTTAPSAPTLTLTASQRAPCQTPRGEPLATQGDDDALKIRLATLLAACAREKRGLVEAVDGFNAAGEARPWWRFW
jgi:hypothetical protein